MCNARIKLLCSLLIIFNALAGFSQSVQCSGVARNASGEALANVSVVVKGTKQGTVTDSLGRFSLAVNVDAVLIISLLNYEPQQVEAAKGFAGRAIMLKPQVKELEETVVIGYGTAKKSDLTGSVTQVNMKQASQNGYTNVLQAVAGKVPGVLISENSGQPGAGLSIEIRGTGSLSFSSSPLYVIDGIPMDLPDVGALYGGSGTLGTGATTNPLSAINPGDIASIEVLKDASATAIYGSRGSNGVVLITTKSGQSGKAKVSLSYTNGFSNISRFLDLLPSREYAVMSNEAIAYRNKATNANHPVGFTEEEMQTLRAYDHQREIFKTAEVRDLNVNVSGGAAGTKYYISGQLFDQEGIVPETGFKRYHLSASLTNDIGSRVVLKTKLNLTKAVSNGNAAQNIIGSALAWAPSSPFINPDGQYNLLRSYLWGTDHFEDPVFGRIYYNARFDPATALAQANPSASINPLAFFDKATNNGITNVNHSIQVNGNIDLDYKINDDLRLNGVFGVVTYNSLVQNYIPTYIPVNGIRGNAYIGNLQSTKLLYQATLAYNKELKKHHLNAVAGATAERFTQNNQGASSNNFTTNVTGVYNIAAGQNPQTPTSSYSGYQVVSTLARASYHYDYKYYLTATGRFDGSSRFAEENHFGFFPSIGASWRVDKERWYANGLVSGLISDLKLRASYGLTGNQAIPPYSTLSTLSSTNMVFGAGQVNAGFSPSRLPNPGLVWERTKQFNAGADIGFFNNRVQVAVDYYERTTSNLLYNVNIPATSGFTSYTKNVASINNTGLEVDLQVHGLKRKHFNWQLGANISFNRGKVISLSGNSADFLGLNNLIGSAYLSRLQPGQPIGQFFGYITMPTWNDSTIKLKPAAFQPGAREGDRRYKDVNNDGLLTDADRAFIGSAMPDFSGGFSGSFSYKAFDLSFNMSFMYGNKVFNQLAWTYASLSGYGNAFTSEFYDRYIPIQYADPSHPTPAERAQKERNYQTRSAAAGALFDNREVADYYLEDGSFLRCKDINIGYTFPAGLLKQYRITGMKVFLNLQNLFTITKYRGYNPELFTNSLAQRGLDAGTYPLSRTIRVGINLSF